MNTPARDHVTFEAVDASSPSAQSVLRRYFGELDRRFCEGFDVPRGGGDDVSGFAPPGGVFLVARDRDVTLGCGGLAPIDDTTAEIKRMWIDPTARGHGLGRRLLARLETEARELGYRRVQLDTNSSLAEAIAMYGRAGYQPIERYNDNPYAHHWFAKEL